MNKTMRDAIDVAILDLETFESLNPTLKSTGLIFLREALAEQPAQGEAVAFVSKEDGSITPRKHLPLWTELFTAPAAPSVPDDAKIDTLMLQIGVTVECHAKHWGLPMYGKWPEFYREQVRAMLAAAPEPSEQPAQGEAVPNSTRTAPERIWLCLSDEEGDEDMPFPRGTGEVTWAEDQPVHVTVEYVRADLAAQPAPSVPDDVAKDAARFHWLQNDARNTWSGDQLLDAIESDLALAVDRALLGAAPEQPR